MNTFGFSSSINIVETSIDSGNSKEGILKDINASIASKNFSSLGVKKVMEIPFFSALPVLPIL